MQFNNGLNNFLVTFPDWQVKDGKLHRDYVFKNFAVAFAFMTQVAEKAEEMNHHPEWKNVYNHLVVDLVTHDTGAITQKDLQLAQWMETQFLTVS